MYVHSLYRGIYRGGNLSLFVPRDSMIITNCYHFFLRGHRVPFKGQETKEDPKKKQKKSPFGIEWKQRI